VIVGTNLGAVKVSQDDKTKIYCFIAGMWGDNFHVSAAYINGDKLNQLAAHVSSSVDFAKSDIGYTKSGMGDHKHLLYKERFPDGYKLEWVDDMAKHPILKEKGYWT